ncbi:MAG: hypothetical protein ACI8QH_000171 [Flammeovirgaceae bacterium]|jgi:hypothetical protein
MEKITRHNYESFFLDYLEGELSDELKMELEVFLTENPDLAEELEEFESVSLKPEATSSIWSDLKVPSLEDLVKNESLREQLYFRCAEVQANVHDERLLVELLSLNQFKEEYALWTTLKLVSTAESVNREGLYQLPLLLPVTSANYEDFLIARTEDILSAEENLALENFANGIKEGEKDLALADSLRLEAPKGVFYPYKNDLKKKKKGLVLFYRAAAVLLLLGLSASVFTLLNQEASIDSKYAQREAVQSAPDSLKSLEYEVEIDKDSIPTEIKAEQYQLEEWEIREPDPVFVADNKEAKTEQAIEPIAPEIGEEFDEVAFAEVKPVELIEESEQIYLPEPDVKISNEDEMILAEEIPTDSTEQYQTISEMAQDRVADQFNLSDEERDELALSMAKRFTQRAGEALDSEVKKEVGKEGDRLTYSLRIRGFKVSHSKSK